ncbi:MAG: hypothetical protein IID40_08725, partial [Planctomycetes bacterium]|nr:hypothetical protein [Planctomycetota bacterium]
RSVAADAQGRVTLEYSVDGASSLNVSVNSAAVTGFLGGQILPQGGLSITSPAGLVTLDGLIVVPATADSHNLRITDATHGHESGLLLYRVKGGVNAADGRMTLHSPELRMSPAWAKRLGDPGLTDLVLGSVTLRTTAEWIGGREPETVEPPLPDDEGLLVGGPDMQFCQLYGLQQFGRVGGVVGLSLATTSHNVGDADLMWFASPSVQHPFIVMNLYRLKNDRFEQIGQSWIKHGFFALGNVQCGGSCTFESGHGVGNWLGQGCTDTYGAGLNASQSNLGPRHEVNPWTGGWVYNGSHFQTGGPPHNAVSHRLQVDDDDLDPAQNPGATYYAEGYYVILDDINVMNSASWKPITVSGSPGGSWFFGMSGAGTLPTHGFAVIDAWTVPSRVMLAQEVPPVEFISPDGRCILSAKSTDLGGGVFHYEYALLNIDMDRKVGSFSIPVPLGTNVTNVGFHAVRHHDEGVAGYANTVWTPTVGNGEVRWDTTDNPVRWGTLYNFRFDANVGPDPGGVNVTLGMFDPGTPATVTGLTEGPMQVPVDCNTNGVADDCDVDCGAPGCTPPCATSADCNHNGIPDECDTIDNGDFDGDGTVDLDDYSAFADCMAGPDQDPQPASPGCINACLAAFDFDGDGDVDLMNGALFQAVFAGPQ